MHDYNRIILTDVDGVLLEWEQHFTQWMLKRHEYVDGVKTHLYRLLPDYVDDYEMHGRFGIDRSVVAREIAEFNKSAWMSTQPPLPYAVTFVKLLHAEGWTFIPITSQTYDVPAQQLRKQLLADLFGEHVFQNYCILDTGQDKHEALQEFEGTGLLWVEDKPENALKGLELGLRPVLISCHYNKNFSHPDVMRVNNWKQIYYQIIHRRTHV